MSFCRWSDMDFACDLYVYESVYGGYVIHIASMRVVGDIPKQMDIPETLEPIEAWFDQWYDSHQKQMKWLETAEKKSIGLPCDGKTFNTDTAQECLDKMLELRAMGYQFPDYALTSLREEIGNGQAS